MCLNLPKQNVSELCGLKQADRMLFAAGTIACPVRSEIVFQSLNEHHSSDTGCHTQVQTLP
jgi:hypothetical protein